MLTLGNLGSTKSVFCSVHLRRLIMPIREERKFLSYLQGALETSKEKLHISEVSFLMTEAYTLTNCQTKAMGTLKRWLKLRG